jgi:hypothetical protein
MLCYPYSVAGDTGRPVPEDSASIEFKVLPTEYPAGWGGGQALVRGPGLTAPILLAVDLTASIVPTLASQLGNIGRKPSAKDPLPWWMVSL